MNIDDVYMNRWGSVSVVLFIIFDGFDFKLI